MFHEYEYGEVVSVEITVPSSLNCIDDTALSSVAEAFMFVVPVTVELLVGDVMDTTGGVVSGTSGGAPPPPGRMRSEVMSEGGLRRATKLRT